MTLCLMLTAMFAGDGYVSDVDSRLMLTVVLADDGYVSDVDSYARG